MLKADCLKKYVILSLSKSDLLPIRRQAQYDTLRLITLGI